MLNGKTILITGGTGSFGKQCAKTILEKYQPQKLIIFSRDELKQFEMQQFFPDPEGRVRYFIGDVRDKERLLRAFAGVDVVIHAAAMKQVPAAEYNPFEAIKTNVLGAQNILNAALDCGVSRVVALSTDKAASPVNLYGATKLCSDKLFVAANSYVQKGQDTRFSVVRYGNVVGSRGSVIPFFMEKRKQGVLPVTDPRMTRFWITLQQGVQFVLDCIENMVGGELFVPKLPSMNIMDLARTIGPECEIETVGIRPGEKLHEVMITKDDARNTIEYDTHYVIKPEFVFFNNRFKEDGGKPVSEDFEYNSRDNKQWLSPEELKELLDGYDTVRQA